MWMIVDRGTVCSNVFKKILGDIRKCNIKRIFIYSFLLSPKEEKEEKSVQNQNVFEYLWILLMKSLSLTLLIWRLKTAIYTKQ